MRFRWFLLLVLSTGTFLAQAQTIPDSLNRLENFIADTTFIGETEDIPGRPDKVLHAEPLLIDLIRDLGARKGESEWNVGLGMNDVGTHIRYDGLIEYEWAPVNRLGLEVEVPFSIHSTYRTGRNGQPIPGDRIEGLKLAGQYSFYVSERYKTSMAIGYIHEFKANDFEKIGRRGVYKGNQYNPFLVAAKRWGNNLHTLVYTGPILEKAVGKPLEAEYAINTSFHYMITGTRNFLGMEVNKTLLPGAFDMTFRPQMRLGISENMLIGIVTSVPISVERERFGTFLRLIYEPKHRKS